MAEADPIRERYFRSIEWADRATEALLYVGAVLSFVSLVVSRKDYPILYAGGDRAQ